MKIEDTPTNNNGASRAPSGLERARMALAISAGKLAGASGRFLRIGGGTSFLAVPEIQPDVVLITNIFRDQLDRYGELYSVATALNKMLEELPESSTILLNGNDPQVANFGLNAKARRLFFGLETAEVGT